MRLTLLALALTVSAAQAQTDALAWEWSPEPRWLEGVDGPYRAFGGGLDFGHGFTYSTVEPGEVPPVRVVFGEESVARVFDYWRGLRDGGLGTFPGAAYDVSDPAAPRRLNVGFFEDSRARPMNARWDPDGSALGGREYLLVFASDYDPTGGTYAGSTAYDLDTYYGLAARVAGGRTLSETPAALAITPPALRDVAAAAVADGEAVVEWTAAAFYGGAAVQVVDLGTSAVLAEVAPETGAATLRGLDRDRTYTFRVRLLGPGGAEIASAIVTVRPGITLGIAASSSLDPGRAGHSTYGDVWGYTAPDGREYGLLAGRGSGLSVIDVTAAPAQAPVEVGFFASPSGTADAKDVKVFGHHAYLVHEVGPLVVVDLSDPANPVEAGRLDVQPGTANGGAHNVLVAEGKLWVVGGRTSGGAGVRVYSLADPAAPALVGAFHPTHHATVYYHDFEVRGDRAYGSAIYAGGGVDVLDVSDPAAIRLVSTFTYPGAGAHNTCATEDGQTVYVGDEIGSNGNWIRIFDVSDPADAELVGEVVVDAQAAVHNCYVRGDRLFVAHYTEGMRVFDVSDPHAPAEVAVLDTFRQPGYGYRGAWTAYPFLGSGKVLVSDMQTGLWVATLSAQATAEDPAPAPTASLQAWPNPTAGALTLAYDPGGPASARLAVYDVLGRELAVVQDGPVSGPQRASVDATRWPAGVVLARLTLDGRLAATARVTVASGREIGHKGNGRRALICRRRRVWRSAYFLISPYFPSPLIRSRGSPRELLSSNQFTPRSAPPRLFCWILSRSRAVNASAGS